MVSTPNHTPNVFSDLFFTRIPKTTDSFAFRKIEEGKVLRPWLPCRFGNIERRTPGVNRHFQSQSVYGIPHYTDLQSNVDWC